MSSYGSWRRSFFVVGRNFRQVRLNCTLSVRMRILIDLFFLWFFWVSSPFSDCRQQKSATLAQKLQRSCQKCILLEQQYFSRKVCFLKKINIFTIFSGSDETLCRLLPESLPTVLKNWFLHSFSESFCVTLSFSSRKFTPTNGLWGKMFEIL